MFDGLYDRDDVAVCDVAIYGFEREFYAVDVAVVAERECVRDLLAAGA